MSDRINSADKGAELSRRRNGIGLFSNIDRTTPAFAPAHRRAVAVVAEALECLGGNGYVEESPLPRLYRDVPLNSIWEGSGNVQCLEMLRAVKKDAGTLEMVLQEIRAALPGEQTLRQLR